MPRSPAEGAATRGVADLEVPARKTLTRDRRVRSGVDRRNRNAGPPNGIERRRHDRRSHDRRSQRRDDRRARERRTASRRGSLGGHRHVPRVASREHGPLDPATMRMPRLLRAIIITVVAVACLLAATLSGSVDRAGAATAKSGSVRATSGDVAATLSYATKKLSYGTGKQYSRLRLTVKAPGRTTLSKVSFKGAASSSYGSRPILKLADVTGDGTPDAIVQIYTGGAHCCSFSSTAPSTPKGWGKPITRDWGNYGYELVDLGGTPQLEWKAYDERFVGIASSYAGSRSPIQIFRLVDGKYVDVTREFPDYVNADAADQSKDWNDAATVDPDFRAEAGRAAAAAWVADLALLNKYDEAKAVITAATNRGDFGDAVGKQFLSDLGYYLQTWGYVPDATLLGLTFTKPAAE